MIEKQFLRPLVCEISFNWLRINVVKFNDVKFIRFWGILGYFVKISNLNNLGLLANKTMFLQASNNIVLNFIHFEVILFCFSCIILFK